MEDLGVCVRGSLCKLLNLDLIWISTVMVVIKPGIKDDYIVGQFNQIIFPFAFAHRMRKETFGHFR